jgi:aminoglycoside phosphotransferase (APT) family kinase protein
MATNEAGPAEVRRILESQLPDLRVGGARYLGEGWDNRLYLVNDDLIVRVAKTPAGTRQLLTEVEILQAISPLVSLPVPRPEFTHRPTEDLPFAAMGYRMLAGRSLVATEISDTFVDAVVPDLARFLTTLHAIPQPVFDGFGIPVFTPQEWLERHDELVSTTLDDPPPMLGVSTRERFMAWWSNYRQDPAAISYEPRFIHGDLACEHVLVEREPWRVTGVIDFGDAMVADPALDISGFPDSLAAEVIRLMQHLGDREAVWKRRDAYRQVSPLHAIYAGLERGDSTLLDEGIIELQRCFSP